MSTSWATCWHLIRADTHRVSGRSRPADVVTTALRSPATRLLICYRIGGWALRGGPARLPVRLLCSLLYAHWGPRFGVEIPFRTTIGPGLKLVHIAGGVVVNPDAVIGRNCTIHGGVTIAGSRVIGDDVRILAGAKVTGGDVGDNVWILANAVVTKDVADDSMMAGVPARPIPGATPPEPVPFADWPRLAGEA